MRACIEGKAPPKATDRQITDKMKPATIAFKRKYSSELLEAIDWAMEVDPMLRPQNIDQFLNSFYKPDEQSSGSFMKRVTRALSGKAG